MVAALVIPIIGEHFHNLSPSLPPSRICNEGVISSVLLAIPIGYEAYKRLREDKKGYTYIDLQLILWLFYIVLGFVTSVVSVILNIPRDYHDRFCRDNAIPLTGVSEFGCSRLTLNECIKPLSTLSCSTLGRLSV